MILIVFNSRVVLRVVDGLLLVLRTTKDGVRLLGEVPRFRVARGVWFVGYETRHHDVTIKNYLRISIYLVLVNLAVGDL